MAAISATFADWRPVKTRKVLQLVFEVPLEQTEQVLQALGVPQPDKETWCAIALLDMAKAAAEAERPRKKWDELKPSQQAAIACDDPRFQKWAMAANAEEAAATVRTWCGVASRAELDRDDIAAKLWGAYYVKYRQHTGLETEMRR